MFCCKFSPQGWRVFKHLCEAPFDGFYRKYIAQDRTNDLDKGLQGCTSLISFLDVIVTHSPATSTFTPDSNL